MRVALRLLRRNNRLPSPGSSLLNPRSHRSKLRQMAVTHAAQERHFEEQALFAEVGKGHASPPLLPRSKKERTAKAVIRRGRCVAESAKHMSDGEWEGVSISDKHAFAKHMSKMLREYPTETTEQQRRRYFELTMVDPRDLDPQKTVRDEYERVKLGLPVHLKNPQHSLGVSQAVYDAADASLFDPDNVYKLENAMTHIKQVFADYVQKKREGVSTEAERRQLANMTAELNLETQKHLANMFKYAETKLRHISLEERHCQLAEIERLRKLALRKGAGNQPKTGDRNKLRLERLKRVISRAVGLDINVAESILTEMRAQEEFLQFCEVFTRLTQGSGFKHTSEDETLGAYVENLRKLYSMNPYTFSTLDVVQYYAAKEGSYPVDWAKRWYEKALLLPLQNTPEYKQLLEIQERERAALKTKVECGETSDIVAEQAECEVARLKVQKVVNIMEKMFMDPQDKRLELLHEKRLRYLAHMQMERQIKRVRENAKLFEGVEHTPEAEKCSALYKKILERGAALTSTANSATDAAVGAESPSVVVYSEAPAENGGQTSLFNVYEDAQAAALFEEIRETVKRVIKEKQVESAAAAKTRTLHRIVRSLKGGERSLAEELRVLQQQRREKITQRLLGIVENDVKTEMEWLENMEEAERPPLLPIPEGMSYVSAADVQEWREIREENERKAANPFERLRRGFCPEFLGQTWRVPDKPLLFWGTGVTAVQQALQHAAEDAERRRRGVPLAPPYPCAENPWGWRLARDILDDD